MADQQQDAIARYIEYGEDITLLQRAIQLTPQERLEELICMLEFVEKLKKQKDSRSEGSHA